MALLHDEEEHEETGGRDRELGVDVDDDDSDALDCTNGRDAADQHPTSTDPLPATGTDASVSVDDRQALSPGRKLDSTPSADLAFTDSDTFAYV